MATFKGYPYDSELFLYKWQNENDPVMTTMFESGAVVENADITQLIANGSDLYTIPFYKVIGGDEDNYDGDVDITLTDVEGCPQTGVVYGRAHGWKERDIVVDFNSGADPMSQIASQVAKYWQKKRQTRMIKILDAVFGITGNTEWTKHTTDLTSSTTTVTDANKFGATTVNDALQKAVGDAKDQFGLVFMHSKVATQLENLNLLEFAKYTDPQGITRNLSFGQLGTLTVVVNDECPVADNKYTTYVLGNGAIQFASAPVENPTELARDALKGGGFTALVTRIRETIHPNGFSFKKPSGGSISPSNDVLANKANWEIAASDCKNIALCKIVTNA